MKNFITVVKTNPAVCATIFVAGFALGALHHYFGL